MHTPTIFRLLITTTLVYSSNGVTLYPNDPFVIELDEFNFDTQVRMSSGLWIVQFYNHWCGHCHSMAPVWKQFAMDINRWRPLVRVGVYNCAMHDCHSFGVHGTPTLKIYYQNQETYPIGVPHVSSELLVRWLKETVLVYMEENVPPEDGLKQRSIPDLGSDMSDLTGTSNHAAIVYESAGSRFGMEVILDMNQQKAELPVYRAKPTRLLSPGNDALVVVNSKGEEVLSEFSKDRDVIVSRLAEFVTGAGLTTVSPILPDTTTIPIQTAMAPTVVPMPDQVYQSDIENAIKYILFKEIPMQPNLNYKLRSLNNFLESLVKHTPNLRPETRSFLESLSLWVRDNQHNSISSQDFKRQVTLLDEQKKPFQETHTEYIGCKGSNETFRGYPCALWTLFHVMSVSEDKQNMKFPHRHSSVLFSMQAYIKEFFSCTECAANFAKHSAALGGVFRQQTGQDAILWIWQAHNMANSELSGDMTEDPNFPKIQWPSRLNCPTCRAMKKQEWVYPEVYKYLIKVYSAENIILNVTDSEHNEMAEIEREIQLLLRRYSTAGRQARQIILNFCSTIKP